MKLTENILNPAGKTLKAYIPPTVEFDELEEEQFMAGSPIQGQGGGTGEMGGEGDQERGAKAASFIFEDDADMEMPEADIDF
ncbi:MAG: hypothetical protein KBT34_15100 [Prevotella sp.]|nr:hypothetical protein [Candidatus Prevotella equi]